MTESTKQIFAAIITGLIILTGVYLAFNVFIILILLAGKAINFWQAVMG